jgi:arylsulfatase A-like enzyme
MILDALDRAGLCESTLVIFTSDHGIPFSRAKGYLYDTGTGIPLLLRWPDGGLTGGTTVDTLASNVDFLPTLFELIGLPIPDDVDGKSFAGQLDVAQHGSERSHRDAIFGLFHDHRRWGFAPDSRSVRTDRYKLIRNFESGSHFEPPIDLSNLGRLGRDGLKTGDRRPPVELYDLASDPQEFDNVADDPEYSEICKQLDQRLMAHLSAVGDPILDGPPASPFAERALEEFERASND